MKPPILNRRPHSTAPTTQGASWPTPPITDVIFDFCGVLLDWNTRACLEGRFPDEIVERICADDDPCGFSATRTAWTPARIRGHLPDVVREQGQELADIFKFYIGHYADALPRTLPGMVELLADLKAPRLRRMGV